MGFGGKRPLHDAGGTLATRCAYWLFPPSMGEGQEGQSGFHGFKAEAGPASLGSDDDGDLSPPPDGADASAAATAGRTDPARQRVRGAPAQENRKSAGEGTV